MNRWSGAFGCFWCGPNWGHFVKSECQIMSAYWVNYSDLTVSDPWNHASDSGNHPKMLYFPRLVYKGLSMAKVAVAVSNTNGPISMLFQCERSGQLAGRR